MIFKFTFADGFLSNAVSSSLVYVDFTVPSLSIVQKEEEEEEKEEEEEEDPSAVSPLWRGRGACMSHDRKNYAADSIATGKSSMTGQVISDAC